jgi:hypothetical protein
MSTVFAAFIKEHLVTDTDAQQRLAAVRRSLDKMGRLAKSVDGKTEGSDSGQNQPRSGLNILTFAAQHYIAADVPKGVADAFDVAHTIVDNNYHELD